MRTWTDNEIVQPNGSGSGKRYSSAFRSGDGYGDGDGSSKSP